MLRHQKQNILADVMQSTSANDVQNLNQSEMLPEDSNEDAGAGA